MKQFLLTTVAGLTAAGQVFGAGQDLWVNYGYVFNPQIDAVTVINAGSIATSTLLPLTTQNTLNFTNRGNMTGSVGFRFSLYPDIGTAQMENTFENLGVISVYDSYSLYYSSVSSGRYSTASYIVAEATNLNHSGTMTVGGAGLVRLVAKDLKVLNGGINASDVGTNLNLLSGSSIGTGFYSGLYSSKSSNYANASGISDLYWGLGTNGVIGSQDNAIPLDTRRFGNLALYSQSPSHEVLDVTGYTNIVTVPQAYSYYYNNYSFITFGSLSNSFLTAANETVYSPTNQLVQVVFVQTNAIETNLTVQVRFAPTSSGVNTLARDVIVEYKLVDTDVVSGNLITNAVYFIDSYAAVTNSFFQKSLLSSTWRPNNFQVTRSTPMTWTLGTGGNIPYTTNIFYDPTLTNYVVTNSYSAYGVTLGLSSSITNYALVGYSSFLGYYNPALTDPTNSAGRVELQGEQMDLTGARVRCDGLLTIKTTNLLSTAGAQLDTTLCNIELGSAGPTLVVSNMFPVNVKRLKGQISGWSAIWTNYQTTLGPIGTNGLPTTNINEIKYQVLFVGNTLETTQPVLMNEFIVHSTNQFGANLVLTDDLTVSRNLRIESQSLTSKGTFSVPSAIGLSNFPNLLNFTNFGYLSVPGDALFVRGLTGNGSSGASYDSWVNYGLVSSAGFHVSTRWFVNQGGYADLSRYYSSGVTSLVSSLPSFIYASQGAALIEADHSVMDDASLYAATDVNFTGGDFYFNKAMLSAGQNLTYTSSLYGVVEQTTIGNLQFRPTRSLYDSGWQASNQWYCVGSVQLLSRPTSGDLLGTKIFTVTPKFGTARHIWAGENRGANPAGFTNNAALGWLVLDGGQASKIHFEGVQNNSALYVDYLEFQNNATNVNTAIDIASNLCVYFANANLPVEKLDGRFNGRLRWVSSYVGPNSTTNMTLPSGKVQSFNIALAQSTEIDSDWDGVANAFDPTPFYTGESVDLNLINKRGPPPVLTLSWQALGGGATNWLEYTTRLFAPDWQTVTNFVNDGLSIRVAVDVPVLKAGQRFYRARVQASQ